MSIKQGWISKSISAAILASTVYAAPALALVCPMGEVPSGKTPEQCVKRDAPKPQLDVEKYSGAQKAQATACNKVNAAHAVIIESSTEIARINASLNEAHHHLKTLPKDGNKDAATADIAKWKELRKTEEAKLKQAQADENAGKKEHRTALKQLQKDGGTSLACI